MDEFDLIDRFFKPLARGFRGSLDLTDDAALIAIPDGMELVITKDAISEGIHFIGNEDPALIAKKLLRVNLSDLAAKGAKPIAYFLALMLPSTLSSPRRRGSISTTDPRVKPEDDRIEWIERFAQGLQEDQALYNIHLAGGDTTATLGRKSFSITAIGTVPKGQMLRRSTARVGDIIFVSGTLSDSALGLSLLSPAPVGGRMGGGYLLEGPSLKSPHPGPPPNGEEDYLINRYLLPQPRLELGLLLHGVASACMDISDGLVQDLGHICKASGVAAMIEADKIPLSPAARAQPDHLTQALTSGDDYELLFTVPPENILNVPEGCAQIGVIKEGTGVTVISSDDQPMTLAHKGYRHFT